MNTKIINFRLILFFIISLLMQSCSQKEAALWEKLEVIKQEEGMTLNIRNIHRTSNGVLLATGYYNDKDVSCGDEGLMFAFNCKLFKVYRSLDEGKSWQDISDDDLSRQQALIKGDKLDNVPDFFLARWAKNLKNLLSPLLYSDQFKVNHIFSDENGIYMYIGGSIYISNDNGLTWQIKSEHKPTHVNKEGRYVFKAHVRGGDKGDFVFLSSSHYALQQRIMDITEVWTKGKDGLFRESKSEELEKFTILNTNLSDKKLLLPPHDLTRSFGIENGMIVQGANKGEFVKLSEIHETKSGEYFSTILQGEKNNKQYSYIIDNSHYYLWKSSDKGKSFTKVKLYEGDDSFADKVKILGSVGDTLILQVGERYNKNGKAGEGRMWINKWYIYDTNTKRLSHFVFPDKLLFSMDEEVKFSFDHKKGIVYLSTLKGIYKSKAGYFCEVFKRKRHLKTKGNVDKNTYNCSNQSTPTEGNDDLGNTDDNNGADDNNDDDNGNDDSDANNQQSATHFNYDLLELLKASKKCNKEPCFKSVFPFVHFLYFENKGKNTTFSKATVRPKSNVIISKIHGNLISFQLKWNDDYSSVKLSTDNSKAGADIINYFKNKGFKEIDSQNTDDREVKILQVSNKSLLVQIEIFPKKGLTKKHQFEVSSDNKFYEDKDE